MTAATTSEQFDFIFTGGGCAGLSLVMRMIRSAQFHDKKILLIDKVVKNANDRTWCFWEEGPGFFEDIVYKRWDHLDFQSNSYAGSLDLASYQYKMIRGIDFYNYCHGEIKKHPNVTVILGEVRINVEGSKPVISVDGQPLDVGKAIVFNSIYDAAARQHGKIYLLQHFKGWVIETDQAVFDASKAVLMDFRVSQQFGTTFAYLLPLTGSKALVEYTLFSETLLEPDLYDEGLKNYIREFLRIPDYRIIEQEFGVIPMTNARYSFAEKGLFNLGTAGGQTKPSSGYTFRFIQKHSDQMMAQLMSGRPLQELTAPAKRFAFYDTVLLRILQQGKPPGSDVFSTLFQRNKASRIFRFLDNETSLPAELKIISTLPTLPFLKAALATSTRPTSKVF